MFYALSALTGFCIAVMIVTNGALSDQYGVYAATVIIHITGLLLISAVLALRKERVRHRRDWSLWLYAGGAVGVATTAFNNLAFGKIPVSAILALGLLGQCVTSLLLDQFGLLGMPRRAFRPVKLTGVALVVLGIAWMTLPVSPGAWVPILVSLASGVTIVVSRTLNAGLAQQIGEGPSTFYNYAVGLAVALLALGLLGRGEPLFAGGAVSWSLPMYLGGGIGVLVVFLSNLTVKKVSSFYMTLLVFIGQVFTGLGLDLFLTGRFSRRNLVGGLLVAAGLTLNLLLDRRREG